MSNWMFQNMKMGWGNILAALMFLQLLNATYAMSCTYEAGVTISIECPTPFQDKDKVFCCYNSDTMAHCCNLNEFIGSNTPILVGIIVGCIVLILILVICSCCCCSCCLLAKRRQQRGTVLYAPRI